MAIEHERDQAIDRLLKESLSAPHAGRGDHLDAETLAAWIDGGLEAARAGVVEVHLSDCPRCQAMLAAFERSEVAASGAAPVSDPTSKVTPFAPRRFVRWALPLAGTLAASFFIFIFVRSPEPTEPAQTLARADRPSEDLAQKPQAVPPPPAAAESGPTAPAGRPRQEAPVARGTPPTASKQPQSTAQGEPPPPAARAAAEPPQKAAAATPTPMAPPPAAAPPPVQTQTAAGLRSVAESVAGFASAPVIAEFSSADMRASLVRALPDQIAARTTTGARAGGGRGGAGGGGGRTAAASPVAQEAPTPVRWRIFSTGGVQRATGADGPWEPVVIENAPGITGGTAPSPTTCWLIGRAGLVLVSTDGRTFSRVEAPTSEDLASIRATSAERATIVTASGREFSTTDAGKTWKAGGLQGF